MAINAFKILMVQVLVRADFFVTENNEIFINEVNTMPGFTPVSMYPLIMATYRCDRIQQLINKLINLAIERHAEKQQLQYNKD